MCFFPRFNYRFVDAFGRSSGIPFFDCGVCPECLSKRANQVVLRCYAESKLHADNCMITLTYDNFRYDKRGNIVGELPVDSSLHVCKRDCQLFFKRLRKAGYKFKYYLTAEYGKRTHRAHYHAILFGVKFSDAVFYKMSKRGNPIKMSKSLTRIWGHGICTVDSDRIYGSIARYCSKYVTKDSRSSDTFSLQSHGLGLSWLLANFNGKSYWLDGHEYPVPKRVWQDVIESRYFNSGVDFSSKYVNLKRDENGFILNSFEYYSSSFLRYMYRVIRDSDFQYNEYLKYWSDKILARSLLPVKKRILLLDNSKYFGYKYKALEAAICVEKGIPVVPPRVNSLSVGYGFSKYSRSVPFYDVHLPLSSRHITANDTSLLVRQQRIDFGDFLIRSRRNSSLKFLENPFENFVQENFF